jgi:putative transposase
MLTEEISKRLKQILEDMAEQYQFIIIASEVMPDHIHLLIEAPPRYSPSNLVNIIKSLSSRRLREEFKDYIKKYIWKDNTLWAKGYYLATLADKVTTDIVKEYINNQKSKDKFSRSNEVHKQALIF